MTQSMSDEREKSRVLFEITIALAQAGEVDRALDMAQTFPDPRRKFGALTAIMVDLAENGLQEF
jgi:hypothetical protein